MQEQTKQEVTYDVLNGKVVQTITTLAQDIDSKKWVPIKRDEQGLGLSVEEFKAAMAKKKQADIDAHQKAMTKLDSDVSKVEANKTK